MATESEIITELLARHPNRLDAKTDEAWRADSVFTGVEAKSVHVLDVEASKVTRTIRYRLVRRVGEPNSVRAEGRHLAADAELTKAQLFRKKVYELAQQLYLHAGANGHRGVRWLEQFDTPSGYIEMVPKNSETPVQLFVWLDENDELKRTPVDLAALAPHLLK